MTYSAVITIRFSSELKKKLDQKAKGLGIKTTDYIRFILAKSVEDDKVIKEIRKESEEQLDDIFGNPRN